MASGKVCIYATTDEYAYLVCEECGNIFMTDERYQDWLMNMTVDELRNALTEHAEHCPVESESQPG